MQIQVLSKKILIISIGLLLYFALAFSGLTAKIDLAVVDVIYELITIPLILLVLTIFLFTLFQFIIKRKANFYLISSSVINFLIIILMFSIR